MQPTQKTKSDTKLFKLNSAGIHPLFLTILIFISGNLIYVSTSSRPNFNVDKPHFQLGQSNAFKSIINCSDNSDCMQCFGKYRSELSGESRNGMRSISFIQLESCLDGLSSNTNDLAALLNIQTCYHQADILDRAVEFNTTSTGSSWFVIAGVIISLLIQAVIAIHSIVNFIFRHKDFEHHDRNIRYLGENFEILNEKQVELYNTVSSLIGTIKSETRNLQGRLNRGGDVRREIENISENLDKTIMDFTQLKVYMYSNCGHTAAILPPLPIETSNYYQKLPQGKKAHTSNKNSTENYRDENNTKFYKTSKENNVTEHEFSSLSLSSKTEPIVDTEWGQDETGYSNGNYNSKSFDISTTKGREKWKKYMKEQLLKPKITEPSKLTNMDEYVLKPVDTNHRCDENESNALNIKYQDVLKRDQNNKKFRRIFVLGRGWVSSKKLEQEELKFGSSSFIKLENQES